MTPRERMLKALEFDRPDRIPLIYHPSPAGLHVHGQKLLELFRQHPSDNPIRFDAMPAPPPGTVDASSQYHELRTDEWGVEWEFRIFGIQGHPRRHPFGSWEEAADRPFPKIAAPDAARIAEEKRRFLVFAGNVSIFEKLHALRPMDDVLVDLATENPVLLAFLDRLVEHWRQSIDTLIAAGADVIFFGDDWGTQTGPLVSPDLFRGIFKPRYRALIEPVHRAGRRVFFHCCGSLGPIFDELVDLGIDGLWPQIGTFEAEPRQVEVCRERRITVYIHPDRQRLVPLGAPTEIDSAIRSYAERHHAFGGGGIFYVEIENDAPFENVKALIESVEKWR